MNKICVFAGTSEGREILDFLADFKVETTACVATEYGETLIENGKIKSGRMNKTEMEEFLSKEKFDFVIDATHPYAQIVTENIVFACAKTDVEYLRLNRGSLEFGDCVFAENVAESVGILAKTKGNILSTIGSKELDKFENCGFLERLYARVLPLESSIQAANKIKLPPSHIIAMQGPFSYELNSAMVNAFDIKIMLTKDTGKNGGFEEKLKISKDLGLKLVVIKKPEQEKGYNISQIKAIIEEKYEKIMEQKIYFIACGVGNENLICEKARQVLRECDMAIGAKRLAEKFCFKNLVCEIRSEKIADLIKNNPQKKKIAVIFTGDIGFYSGATKLYKLLENYEIETICGISSPIYLCSKLKKPWENVKLISLHARKSNIISAVCENEKVFALLGGENNVNSLCELFCKYKMENVVLNVGENLSYENEKITTGTAKELLKKDFSSLSCILIENKNAEKTLKIGIKDEDFERIPKVPMTKSEIRAVTISKLELNENSVIYDIGAGTGSVSVEMALNARLGTVYAIEKNADALVAIAKNKIKFKTDNLEIIDGFAPLCMKNLPVPSHVFIGGSSGNLAEIVEFVLAKNAKAKFVVNTVTLETLGECMEISKKFDSHEVVEISSSKSKEIEKYNLMIANNPIYIISFQSKN